MSLLGGYVDSRGTALGAVAEGERDMIAQHDLLTTVGKAEILAKPSHLRQ